VYQGVACFRGWNIDIDCVGTALVSRALFGANSGNFTETLI